MKRVIGAIIPKRENQKNYKAVSEVIRIAFTHSELGYNGEAELVERLRHSDAYIPELSLIAEYNSKVIGHIILSRIHVINKKQRIPALALAPVSVLPEFQGQKVGSTLIEAAHNIAHRLKEKYIILIGHKDYYPRFGYEPCDPYGIELPFPIPKENCMIHFLQEYQHEDVSGMVEYSAAFGL